MPHFDRVLQIQFFEQNPDSKYQLLYNPQQTANVRGAPQCEHGTQNLGLLRCDPVAGVLNAHGQQSFECRLENFSKERWTDYRQQSGKETYQNVTPLTSIRIPISIRLSEIPCGQSSVFLKTPTFQ